MERWKMNRLGFRNFWLYDKEDFWVEDGHLLLRGNNASGKSITTQSFIPFILDGNRSPERLDPFGTRERKMDFYLLGDGEKDESTGYLFLEFKKQNLEVYLTISIGMRAQKGKGIDFWGFCLCDGRRIGYDFELYDKIGSQMLPLSKRKLKNTIADPDNWVEAPGAYKKLVNDRVYQFPDIRQFDQMVQLLIKMRTPKLSKDAFRPTEVKNILNDSLQVLSDDDLSAMVSTMEQMDGLTDILQGYHAAHKEAAIIRNEYTRYNQFILGMKGKAYSDACEKTLKQRNALQDRQRDLERFSSNLDDQTQRRDSAHTALTKAKGQREAMGDGDLVQQQNKLAAERENERAQKQQLDTGIEQLTKLENAITQKEIQLREQQQAVRAFEAEISSCSRQLENTNQILLLGEEHETYIKSPLNDKAVRAALRGRKDMISTALDALRKQKQGEAAYDQVYQELEQAESQERNAAVELQNAQLQEQEERDRTIENFVRWNTACTEFLLSESNRLVVTQGLAQYRSSADWSKIQTPLYQQYQTLNGALLAEKVKLESQLTQLKKDTKEKRIELETVRSRPEPVPLRRSQVEATRIQLVMRGVPHAAFYEAIDFAAGLKQDARDLLEAQLADAGLLDALLIPEESRPQIQELLEEYSDCFLIPGEAVEDPVSALVSDPDTPFAQLAAACLNSISQSDLSCVTALLPDGRFRSGMLKGRSHADAPAGFVGAAARRINRERQITQLEQELNHLESILLQTTTQVNTLEQRVEQLNLEWQQFPNTADLDCAIDMLAAASRSYDNAVAEKQKRWETEQRAKRHLALLEQQFRSCCRGLPYERSEEAYEEAQYIAEEYGDLLNKLGKHQTELQAARQRYDYLNEQIATEYDYRAAQQSANKSQQLILEKTRAVIQEIEAFLARPENIHRANRLRELDEEIARQTVIEQEADKQCIRLTERIEANKSELQRYKQLLTEAVAAEKALENYFLEDLKLGLTDKISYSQQDSLSTLAQKAYSLVPAADRGRTPEQVGEALRTNFQQHNNTLLQYHPKLEMVFDAPEYQGMLRQRYCITLQKDGRTLTLYEFIQTLQTDISLTESVLEENDRKLFEDILMETISHKLRRRIEESQKWCEAMTALMGTLNTSMGLRFSLNWKPRKAENEGELDTVQLVTLLNKDRMLLTKQDSTLVSRHFRAKVKKARQEAADQGQIANYADMIRTVLDYRTWYEFRLFYRRDGELKKELTNRVFNSFSGGEKAMAMYVPLFAAVSAQYQKAGASCPKLLALDEAFAGVDDQNISAMFELVRILDFDYIMNSQALWGCYPCVKNLNIVELHRPRNARFVTILRYFWNGTEKVLQEDADD